MYWIYNLFEYLILFGFNKCFIFDIECIECTGHMLNYIFDVLSGFDVLNIIY